MEAGAKIGYHVNKMKCFYNFEERYLDSVNHIIRLNKTFIQIEIEIQNYKLIKLLESSSTLFQI